MYIWKATAVGNKDVGSTLGRCMLVALSWLFCARCYGGFQPAQPGEGCGRRSWRRGCRYALQSPSSPSKFPEITRLELNHHRADAGKIPAVRKPTGRENMPHGMNDFNNMIMRPSTGGADKLFGFLNCWPSYRGSQTFVSIFADAR